MMTAQKLQTVQKNQKFRRVEQAIASDKKFIFRSNSGSSSYSYVALRIEPCALEDQFILIENQLKKQDEVLDMLEIMSHINEALVDYCSGKEKGKLPIANTKFIIIDTNYNLVDFKPFRYYECTRMLLDEMFKNVK